MVTQRKLFVTSCLLVVAWLGCVLAQTRQGTSAVGTAPGGQGASSNHDWRTYLGGVARNQYSPLDQIDRRNVSKLRVAWTYDSGDKGEYQSNNLIVRGVLYTATPTRKIVALDASSGRELWKWDPTSERPGRGGNRQRGIVYWEAPDGTEARLFTGVGNYLYALDPRTGQVIRSFAANGSLHLGTGAALTPGALPPNITLNTPGVVYKDLYLVGGNTNGPGSIRAYDVRSGALRWIFHTIPRPGEFGYDTWPASGTGSSGGASNWSGASLDEARGILYVPTESPTPDFWRGSRYGANLFGNSLIALDANTGKRLWHYQIVHHDLLDKDLPTPPVLLTVTHGGRKIDAVAQGTKHGLLFVFDRVTGAPLWPIEERPVPSSEIPEAKSWPTQPFPTKPAPLTRQDYTADDVSIVSPTARATTLQRITVSGSFGPFPPPSVKERILFPGYDGGMEWGGGAVDPDGVYYVNVNEIPWLYQLVPVQKPDGTPVSFGERSYIVQCASCHGIDRAGAAGHSIPPLTEVASRLNKDGVLALLDRGGARMPSFSNLDQGRRRAIVDYLFGVEQPETAYRPKWTQASQENPDAAARPDVVQDPEPYAFPGFFRWRVEGYPAISPPWGTLNAVDLNTGEIKWKVPLGEYPELTAKGIPPTGTENYGGPVATAGGLIFIGATDDNMIRAFDKATGKVLWQAPLPFAGNATPSVYMVNGKQYIVIAAGGGKWGRPAGGHLVAFALPD